MLPASVQPTLSRRRGYADILANGLKPSRDAVFRLALCAWISAAGCGDGGRGSAVIRLQDVFDAAVVEGSVGALVEIPRTEWRFNDDDAHGWQVGVGVEELGVTNGRLAGRTTTARSSWITVVIGTTMSTARIPTYPSCCGRPDVLRAEP